MALKSTLAKRLFFGSIMLSTLIGLLVGDGWFSVKMVATDYAQFQGFVFSLLLTIVLSFGAVELIRLARNKGYELSGWVVIPAVVLLVTQPIWSGAVVSCWQGRFNFLNFPALILIFAMFAGGWVQARRLGVSNTLSNLGLLSFVLVYLGVGGWFLVQIRLIGLSEGTIWGQIGPVILFLLCVKSADIGAYFTGRACGKHLWVPTISPAKTWEGVVGGIVLATIVASLFSILFDIMSITGALVFGLCVSVAGQLGDLLESMIKRDVGVKDSAGLVPAFGGVLDLVDSVVIAAPPAYIVLQWMVTH